MAGVGTPISSDFDKATYVLHTQASNPETMALARDTMKKLKAQGWAEFSHRKSAATGTSTCIYVMEDDEKKHRDVYALLTGALLGVPKDSFKWVLTWTTQHRATEIVEFFSAK